MSKQIEALRKLGLSDEEIQQVLEDDKRIDRGEKLFELSSEQEKASKQARKSGIRTVAPNGKQTERKRKEDSDKATLVNALFSAILPMCESYEVQNAEREFTFTYNGRKFKVVLSAPRS